MSFPGIHVFKSGGRHAGVLLMVVCKGRLDIWCILISATAVDGNVLVPLTHHSSTLKTY